jgi:hypothetical protein
MFFVRTSDDRPGTSAARSGSDKKEWFWSRSSCFENILFSLNFLSVTSCTSEDWMLQADVVQPALGEFPACGEVTETTPLVYTSTLEALYEIS